MDMGGPSSRTHKLMKIPFHIRLPKTKSHLPDPLAKEL
jgi:hypothetical protein